MQRGLCWMAFFVSDLLADNWASIKGEINACQITVARFGTCVVDTRRRGAGGTVRGVHRCSGHRFLLPERRMAQEPWHHAGLHCVNVLPERPGHSRVNGTFHGSVGNRVDTVV